MVLFILAIIAAFLVTYTITGAVYVSKGNMPEWAQKVFKPYVKFATAINIPLLPFEEIIEEGEEKSPSIINTPIFIFEPEDKIPEDTAPSTPETQIGVSPGPKVSAAAKKNMKCSIQIGAYSSNVDILNNIHFPSIESNAKTVTNLCNIGKNLITNDCTTLFFDPIDDPSFVNLCCNGTADHSNCTDGAIQCTLNKSKFYNQAYNLSNFNDAALANSDNANKLADFCNLGTEIMSNKCLDDDYYPMKNDVFKKYCCNGSSDSKDCNADSFKCAINSSDFMNKDYSTQNVQLSSIEVNKDIIKNYCDTGIDVLRKNCALTNPMKSQNFKDTCCNSSENPDDCNENSYECTLKSSRYNNKAYNLQNLTLSSASKNTESLSDFCNIGTDVAKTHCKAIDPTKNKMFTDFCCDTSIDPNDCDDRALQCSFKLSNFTNTEDTTKSMQMSSWSTNKDAITNFCHLGSNIENNHCKLSRPINSDTFINMCCNNSTHPEDCNGENLNCTFDASDFHNSDYNMSNMELPAVKSNKETIKNYCNSGIGLVNKKCTQLNPVNSDKFRSFCCNNSTHPEDCNEQSMSCLFDSGDFVDKNYNVQNIELSAVKTNKDTLIDYCNSGIELTNKKCSQVVPVNSDKFRSFCCNNSTHPEDCNEQSMSCLFTSGDFTNVDYNLQNMELSSVKSNIDVVTNYCKTGIDIIDKKCSQTNPINSDKFRSFCCNNSTHSEDCSEESMECLFNSGDFQNSDYNLQNMDLIAVRTNKDKIENYCTQGIGLINKQCTQTNPVNSDKFRNMCCNNSTHSEDCNEQSQECLFDSGDFANQDYNMKNMELSAVKTNKTTIINYCQLGNKINTNECSQVIPVNSEKYRNFCCNNSTHPEDCNENNISCTFDSGDFLEKDYSLQNMEMSAVQTNKASILEYCALGTNLLSKDCKQTNPINSTKFRQLCCNDSTNPADCNEKALECLFNSGDFTTVDYNMSNMALSSVNTNRDTITEYCKLGENVIQNNCSTHPTNSDKFRTMCCNNSNHPTDCNERSRECLFDSGAFETMAYSMSNMTLSSVESNKGKIKELCDLGKKIQNNSCSQINPMNTDVYRNFCCNSSIDPGQCTPEALQCTFDSSTFTTKDYNNQNMTLLSIRGENENTIKDYCNSGQNIIENNCNGVIPTNSDQFRNFCCNTENSNDKCTLESLQCTLDSSTFLNKDYSMTNMEIMAVKANKNNVTDYCVTGDSLIENNCKLTYPTTSSKFRQLCCNNTTDPHNCNTKSLECTLKSSEFVNTDYNMTNVNLLSNTGAVTNYCELGIDVLKNNCNATQPMTSNFIKLCCNGVADPNNCSTSSLQCLINSNKIYDKVTSFQTLNYPTNIDNINASNGGPLSGASPQIKEYCSLLQDLKNIPGCSYNTDYVNKYSPLCPVIECVPSLVYFQQRIDNLNTNTTDNKILNSEPICALGNTIIATCPLLTDKVKNYNGFYNTFCPQPPGCGSAVGNTYSQIKYGYKQQPNAGTAQSVCDWGNVAIKTCGDGTLNGTGWYVDYVTKDGIYTPNCPPVDCAVSNWNAWSPCDCGGPGNTVGNYTHNRTVTTNPKNYGSKSCPVLTETVHCTECGPLDCTVSDWSAWSKCSATGCFPGTQTRTRNVTRPAYNDGAVCPTLTETSACTGPCNCVVSDWTDWSTCGTDNCYNDVPNSTRTRSVITPASGGGTPCPYLSESHVCQSSCPYRVYQNTQMYKNSWQGSSWYAGVPNEVECAKRCANQPGCQSASVNGYWYGTWRCDMYNFRNNHYPYGGGFHMAYPWASPLPVNVSGFPNSRNNLLGTWKDTGNQMWVINLDSSNTTQMNATLPPNTYVLTFSVDVTNKAIYWVGQGVVAYMPDTNTMIFNNGMKWIKQ